MVSLCLTWDVSLFHRWLICSIHSPHIIYTIYHDYCLYQLTSGGGPPYLDRHICVSWYLYISWCTWILFVFRHQNIFLWQPTSIYFPDVVVLSWHADPFCCVVWLIWASSGYFLIMGDLLQHLTWSDIPEYPEVIWGIILPYIFNFSLWTL